MSPIEDAMLQRISGGLGFPRGATRLVLRTVEELFPGKPTPRGMWTVWGSKTEGPAPRYLSPSGMHYTFLGRPARDALVVHAPE
jgi:hypothetical protein